MTARIPGLLCVACLVSSLATLALASDRSTSQPGSRPARPASVSITDLERRLDVNRVRLAVSNIGAIGYDITMYAPGLWYPAGSSSTLLYASGLWLGAVVGGAVRVAVSEYSTEFVPGPMVGGGPGNPADPAHRVWKVQRWTGDPQDSAHVERAPGGSDVDVLVHHSWSEYVAGAVPNGAPWKLHRLPDTSTPDPSDSVDVPGPDVLGDLMTWCVFNDADPTVHASPAGSTAPLGAEVEQVVFGFDDPGPVGDVAFVRWRIRNRSAAPWSDLSAGFWADPDLGSSIDDKVGCDSMLSVGFAYNGVPADEIYGAATPVLGTVLLGSSPAPRLGSTSGMHAFGSYINGTDPATAFQTYNALSGLLPDGSVMLDPNDDPTRYQFTGNPLLGTGWLDPILADKRMLASAAPRHIDPDDTLEVWAALIVAPGPDVTAALAGLPCRTDLVRTVFATGFARPFPPASACEAPRNCPRPAGYWEAQCAGAGGYEPPILSALGTLMDQRSVALDFGSDPLGGFCGTLGQYADVRQQAYREYSAFLANVLASAHVLLPEGELPVYLAATTPVSCPAGIGAVNVAELAAPAPPLRTVSGTYQNLVTLNRRALEGVDAGLGSFNGGAGSMHDFFGSTLNPAVDPDSFPRLVRVAFDHTQMQKAYLYLRNELPGGAFPSVGRGYRYAGFVDVPFRVLDLDTGEPLDAAFVERVVTDDFGAIQPAGLQPPSYDGAWAPTTDFDGSREYLFVSRRPYTGVPRAEFATDGVILEGSLPWLFGLWSRLRTSGDVIDDGDSFDFGFDFAYTPGVDALLRYLAGQPLSDPDVATAYQQIADCLGGINRGETVGPLCDEPTPALVSLVSAEAEPGVVRIAWRVSEPGPVTVERREGTSAWATLTTLAPDGDGRVAIEDRDVQAGLRYDYRLRLAAGPAGEVTLEVPSLHRLSLAGFRPNPASGPLAVAFTLASSAPARLEVVDVAGRRVYSRVIERPAAGQRVLPLADVLLAPGVYVLRLEQGGERIVARGVVLR